MGVLDKFSLAQQTALVTGGGRGIGQALALALAEAGADVAVADLDDASAEQTSRQISDLAVRSMAIKADVTKSDQVRHMVDSVVAAWGRLDVAVNNAGIAMCAPAEEITDADWDALLNVDLKAVFMCCRSEGRVMLDQGSGSIINIASMSATIVNRPQQHAHYHAAKAGVVALSRTCAAEWAARGVRVNCISPGHTRTAMTADILESAGPTWIANTPMARLGETADLQGAAVYLASPASAYVTGHDLVVDGGYTIW